MNAIKLLKKKKNEVIVVGGGYYVYTDSGKTKMLVHIPTDIAVGGRGAAGVVDGNRLYTAMQSLSEADITLNNGELILRQGQRQITVPLSTDLSDSRAFTSGLSNDRYTDTPSITLRAKKFAADCKNLKVTAAKNDIRYFIEGVFFDRDKLAMISTDGHRMTVVKNVNTLGGLSSSFIMHSHAIAELCDLIAQCNAHQLHLVVSDGYIKVVGVHGGREVFTLYTKAIDGRYPDWQRVYSVPEHFAEFDASELAREVKFLASNDPNATKVIVISAYGNKVNLKLKDGSCETSVTCTVPPQHIVIGVNARYFIDLLSVAPKGGKIYLGLDSAFKPIVARYGDSADLDCVMMPTRV